MKDETPLLVPVLAALPVSACMAILGLPAIGHGYAPLFRALYFVACMGWLFPLALIQRALWRQRRSWPVMALVLLAVSYAMSIVNNLLGQVLAIELGLETHYRWAALVQGLDSCWLALIAFCAIHAVAVYYLAFQRAQLRLAQALAAARDAELRALRYQVNPHFLFNTLNAISALVSAQANRDANRMIGRVSDFLRATLAHDGRHEHALAEELALTEAYLDIEKVRLGERLTVTMKVGPDVLDACVPYLMLQPLVENAIRHGIAPRSAPGCLDIRVDRDGDLLLVDVCNDGVAPVYEGQQAFVLAASASSGVGGSTAHAFKQTARNRIFGGQPNAAWTRGRTSRPPHTTCYGLQADHGGIGLVNVTERLQHLYGAAQRVHAGWRADGRYQVHIALPLRPAGVPA